MEDFTQGDRTHNRILPLKCLHRFHSACVNGVQRSGVATSHTCPVCRKALPVSVDTLMADADTLYVRAEKGKLSGAQQKALMEEAEAKFILIAEAAEVLGDAEQRRWYDLAGKPKGAARRAGAKGRPSGFGSVGGMNRVVFASMMGDARKVEKLLKRGRDPTGEPWDLSEASFMGFTALHLAGCLSRHVPNA